MWEVNYKKIALLAGFIILSIAIGWAIYALFFSSPKTEVAPIDQATSAGDNGLPEADTGYEPGIIGGQGGNLPTTDTLNQAVGETDKIAAGSITQVKTLTEDSVLAPSISKNGTNLFYYNKNDGKFYRVDKNGLITALSDKKFFDAQNVVWSKQNDKAIIEYPDGANIIYDFNTGKQVSLPKHWEDFDFSPAGDGIISKSIGLDEENRWLIVSNEDGSQAQAIEPLGSNADKVISSWSPNNLSIAMYTESIDFDRQRVYFIGQNKENFKTTTVEGHGFEPLWEPTGKQLVYSVYGTSSDLKPELWIVDAQGDEIGNNRQRLNLQTWASKCTFSGTTNLYCAVPKEIPSGAGIFPGLAESSSDVIYKINLTTGAKTLVAIPEEDININNLMADNNESNIYFTNSATGNIHTIRLK